MHLLIENSWYTCPGWNLILTWLWPLRIKWWVTMLSVWLLLSCTSLNQVHDTATKTVNSSFVDSLLPSLIPADLLSTEWFKLIYTSGELNLPLQMASSAVYLHTSVFISVLVLFWTTIFSHFSQCKIISLRAGFIKHSAWLNMPLNVLTHLTC